MISRYTFFALLVASTQAQHLGVGPCPNVNVVQNFDVAGYLGQWYQIQRSDNPFEKGDCSTALYGPVDENGLVKVHNTEIREDGPSFVDGTAELANPNSTEAKLIVKFFNPDTVADYWVLGTDYKNYSLVYTCQTALELFHIEFAWVLGRSKPLSAEAEATVNALIAANNLTVTFQNHDLPECLSQP